MRLQPFFQGRRVGRATLCLCSLAALLLAGCGGAKYGKISGKVLHKDKPLPGGVVTMFPVDGKGNPASANINENGEYTIEKVPVGKVKIAVSTELPKPPVGAPGAPTGAPRGRPPGRLGGKDQPPLGDDPISKRRAEAGAPSYTGKTWKVVPINKKFTDSETSGLEYEVTKGEQTHNIELK
jgi:hypothetical protein